MKSLDLEAGLKVLRVISRHTIDDAIMAPQVEAATGVPERTVTDIVTVAAMNGVNVGSCTKGYFFWRNKEERDIYISQEQARLKALAHKISRVKKMEENQQSLFEQDAA